MKTNEKTNKQNFIISMIHLSFQKLVTFIILSTLCTSNSEEHIDHRYETCSSPSESCGKLKNVGYPFWGLGRPQYCGDPALQLHCQISEGQEYPVLTVGQNINIQYLVLAINNTSLAPTIQLRGFYESACPFHRDNNAFDKIFRFSESVVHITIHGCYGQEQPGVPNRFKSCWGNHTAVYHRNDTHKFEFCNTCSIPVLKIEMNHLYFGNNTFYRVLKQGFKVDYLAHPACLKCVDSEGVCGSNGTEFTCLHQTIHGKSGIAAMIILKSAFAAAGIGIFIVLFLIYLRKRGSNFKFSNFWGTKEKDYRNIDAFLEIYGSLAPKRYTYTNIQKMTNNFSEKIGEGGYAIVYKGKLCNGRLVAVKLLKQSKGSGENFVNEVASIGRANHVNIVPLLGFCFEGKRSALIYDYMSNGSLEKFAYHGAREQALQWETLFKIAVGIARGLEYLHRGCNARILHFDIKPHNILLDEDFCPKISDFGLARLCPQQESTISMLEARGTIGYIAPEVFCRTIGDVSHKSDVYSYGMMIIDVVCGRKNKMSVELQHSSEMYFPRWIYKRLEHGEEVASHATMNDEEKGIEKKMIIVSLWCIQTCPSNRPCMSKVIEMLQGDVELIQLPPAPEATMDYNSSEIISLAE